MITRDKPEFEFEEYRGHIIASSKKNIAEESIDNLIIVYEKADFPEYGYIVGLDESKNSGKKEPFPHNMDDARSYIDWRCCINLNRGKEIPDSKLPIIVIEGTHFFVDVTRFQMIEKRNSDNVIPLKNMKDRVNGYVLDYNSEIRNISSNPHLTGHPVKIPEFVELDPVGMAKKYNLTVDEVKNKTDFDLMVDQKEFDLRVNQGRLPTIEIADKLYYVDLNTNMLRPKNDFISKGISFDDIVDNFSVERNSYLIAYDTQKHEFRALDYKSLNSVIPPELIAVELPCQQYLDPVGWNRKNGVDIKSELKQIGIKGHFIAKILPWGIRSRKQFINDRINLERKISAEKMKNITPTSVKMKGRKR